MGAGALAIGLLVDWLGYSPYSTRTILLWGAVLVTIGAPFLILKLGIKRRFLNTIMNPKTSWLSRGFYILAFCIIIGLIILGISILPSLGVSISNWSSPLLVLDIIGCILALATAIYTGILIQSVRYVPLWNTWFLPALFTVSSLSTGTMALIVVVLGYSTLTAGAYPAQLMDALIIIGRVLIPVEALTIALYLFFRYRAEEEGKSSVRLLLSGNLRFVFWMGIVASGFLLPIILEGIYSRLHEQHFLLLLTGIFTLIGGFFIRFAVIYAGIKEQHPMQKLVESQYYLKALRGNDGDFLPEGRVRREFRDAR